MTGGVRVVVRDVGVDACFTEDDDEPVLVLRPAQSFSGAVRAVLGCMPNLHPDEARRLVRKHLPQAPHLEDSLAVTLGAPTPWRSRRRRLNRRKLTVLAGALTGSGMLVGAGVTLAVVHPHDPVGALGIQVPPHQGPLFEAFDCTFSAPLQGVCIVDGFVASVDTSLSVGKTSYTFGFGRNRVVVVDFGSKAAREGELDLKQVGSTTAEAPRPAGRYLLLGDDPELLDAWAGRLSGE